MSKNNIIDFNNIQDQKSKKIESEKILKFDTDTENKDSTESKKSKVNFKNICFIVIIMIILIYPLAYIGNQFVTLAQFESDIKNLEAELESTKNKSKNIQAEINGASSNEFIEKMAREKLKMVKKGEIVYVKIE